MSLNSLINQLESFINTSLGLKEFAPAFMEWVWRNRISEDPISGMVEFNQSRYHRQVLFYNSIFEIVLIGWLPDQETTIHGHPVGGCLFVPIQGQLEETVYSADNPVHRKLLENEMRYIDNTMGTHSVRCVSREPAVSLHIYSPPFTKKLLEV